MAKSLQDASALPRHHRPKHTRGTSSVHNVKSGGSPAPCHSPPVSGHHLGQAHLWAVGPSGAVGNIGLELCSATAAPG